MMKNWKHLFRKSLISASWQARTALCLRTNYKNLIGFINVQTLRASINWQFCLDLIMKSIFYNNYIRFNKGINLELIAYNRNPLHKLILVAQPHKNLMMENLLVFGTVKDTQHLKRLFIIADLTFFTFILFSIHHIKVWSVW